MNTRSSWVRLVGIAAAGAIGFGATLVAVVPGQAAPLLTAVPSVAMSALGSGGNPESQGVEPRRGKATSLRVTVKGPRKVRLQVSIQGPGLRRTVVRSSLLRNIRAGRYVITARTLKTSKGRYFADRGRQTVRVTKGSAASASVVFSTFIPSTTKVMNDSKLGLVSGDVRGNARLSVPSTTRRGDVLVSPPSAEFPSGVLVRVASMAGSTATTLPATLVDAIPSGRIDQTVPVTGALDESNGPRSGVRARSARNPFLKHLTCEGGIDATAQGSIDVTIPINVQAEWGSFWRPHPWVQLSASAHASADFQASVAGHGSCTLARTALLATPIHLPTVRFSLYGVPVWINSELQFYIEGHAEASASVSTSAQAAVDSEIGVRVGDGQRAWFNPPRFTKTFTAPTVAGSASAEIWVGADIQAMIYGQLGGALGVDIGPALTANLASRPWWSLDAQMVATGRLKSSIPLFNTEHDFGHIGPVARFHIADSGGDAPDSGNGGAGGGGGEGGGGTPAVRHITEYTSDRDLMCGLQTLEDTAGEFYETTACGTFLSVDGSLYSPPAIPAGDSARGTAWTPISYSESGTGTHADPYVITTTADAGDSGIRVEQTDRWVEQEDSIATTMRVRNLSGAPKSVLLSRGADCYIGDSDVGTGELSVASGLAGCLRSSSAGLITLRLQALTGGATLAEGQYASVWSMIGAQQPLPNTCQCGEDIDNGVAVTWPMQLDPGQSTIRTSEFSMRRV